MNTIKDTKLKQLFETIEFKEASLESKKLIENYSEITTIAQGQTITRKDIIETNTIFILTGEVRLLANLPPSNELFTIDILGPGNFVGLIDILRQKPCEMATAKSPCEAISIPNEIIVKAAINDELLWTSLKSHSSKSENVEIGNILLKRINPIPNKQKEWLLNFADLCSTGSRETEDNMVTLLSSSIQGYEEQVGKKIQLEDKEEIEMASKLPVRFINFSSNALSAELKVNNVNGSILNKKSIEKQNGGPEVKNKLELDKSIDLESVGLRIAKSGEDLQNFKLIAGKGPINANLATLRMAALAYNTPCPVDVIEKILEGASERSKSIPIHGMGQLAESMGLQTQIGKVKLEKVNQLEFPVIVKLDQQFGLIADANLNEITVADPETGWKRINMEKVKDNWGDEIEILALKRLNDTPIKQFGWSWFTPVVKRFRWPLVQVLFASLFIQLFQLANPLLIQQIIDKVISQSNLSALQVLGAALVVAAFLQGLLSAVRTWLLIDTTDRMDLLLGSQVIDKLLRLPLRFFEARPVGELSQRLSELGTLRGFLTGTAITTVLDLLFAIIYILIMVIYSPLLTAVALGTIPLYALMIIVIAPLYRRLIRKRAEYAARTQSHLIETLSGIQTVKAQHFELNSRWKWQERYSGQIAEGFKSVVLGSSANEIGNFLNQLSSLLIIWVGVYLVVDGNLSLGQLIAFRIISGYVTGPILRLSNLWQGFQQVGISMERLSDIVDQVPEGGKHEADKLSLPPIQGDIIFEDLKFRFGKKGNYQIDNLNLTIEKGSFIGIVGQSGSGKSTLMKLLPRLYEPESGRIIVDGYDISKVSLSSVRQQIGIVPQDCLLFEGTIRENITMNNPDASNEEIIEAARAAAAHDFIMNLSDGYGTRLGERGAGLSGGQKQRIAIARTILQNPSLLVLDEATSALDYETESTVCNNLQSILNNKTVFFITHRLSTVKNADKIVLMHNGIISEQGSHEELISLGGRYAALYAHQGDA